MSQWPTDRYREVNTFVKRIKIQIMRAVIQRVTNASVRIDGKIHSQIGSGLLVLLGIEDVDSN